MKSFEETLCCRKDIEFIEVEATVVVLNKTETAGTAEECF
jgi:hypothetical protein